MKKLLFICLAMLIFTGIILGEEKDCCQQEGMLNLNSNTSISVNYEKGFVWVARHTIQFSTTGTKFDYVEEGNQNVLFPFERYTAELYIGKRHSIVFLYQPLEIITAAGLERDINVNNIIFPAGTVVDLKYGFSFYRLSYLYNIVNNTNRNFSIGASFQIRNASIIFASKDGMLINSSDNIGPVPILKARYRENFNKFLWGEIEADGFYASGKYITGSTNDFVGAIYDVSGRLGININRNTAACINLRYLGGGANGTNNSYVGSGDGFTDNWLHTFSLSLGFYIK